MARWVAFGFLFAFAASVLTVIYTGLMVEGSRAEFDAGFRSVEMRLDEVQAIRFYFDSDRAHAAARLELELPPMLEPATAGGGSGARAVAIEAGSNEIAIELRAVAVGSGYVVARVSGEEPIGRDSVFVTVTGD
jgi:hypothetical protein